MRTYKLIAIIKDSLDTDESPPSDTRLLMYKDSKEVNDFLITLMGFSFEGLQERIKEYEFSSDTTDD